MLTIIMVETAGVEPASVSTLPSALITLSQWSDMISMSRCDFTVHSSKMHNVSHLCNALKRDNLK